MNEVPDTVVEALDQLTDRGYGADFEVGQSHLRCTACGTEHEVHQFLADHVYRFEGDSDPADEAIVIGVTCPVCGAKGSLVSAYGPDADPEELAGVSMIARRYAG